MRAKPESSGGKTPLGPLDPLEAAQSACRNAQEGNRKLALSVEAFREALEIVATGEVDHKTGHDLNLRDMRRIAVEALDKYSLLTGQNWKLKRNKLSGPTRAAGTGNRAIHERDMGRAAE